MHTDTVDSVSIQTQSHASNTLNTMKPFCDYSEFSKESDPDRYMTSVVYQAKPLLDCGDGHKGNHTQFYW